MSTPTNKNLKLLRTSHTSHACRSPFRSPLIQNQQVSEEDASKKDEELKINQEKNSIAKPGENTTESLDSKIEAHKFHSIALKRKFTPDTPGTNRRSSFKTPFKSPLIKNSCNLNDKLCEQSSQTTPKRQCLPRKISIGSSFASPLRNTEKQSTLSELLLKEKQLDNEISLMHKDGYDVKELQTHINKLHYYNDLKDTAQMVMGKLAQLEGISIRAMHEHYGAADLD